MLILSEAPEYLKISEFARLIGVSVVTLRRWHKKGILVPHHVTPAGDRIYTMDQVREYLTTHGCPAPESKVNNLRGVK